MTNEDLEKLCTEWQKTLRLQDWDVSISFTRYFEMGDKRGGECEYILSKKTAVIKILQPSDYSPDFLAKQDVERTVVHELLHLHTGLFMPSSPTGDDTMHEEHLIHSLSGSLVELKRAGSVTAGKKRG